MGQSTSQTVRENYTPLPGDQSFLLLTAIITVCYQLFFFAIAAFFKFDKVTDLAGGTNFVILAFVTFFLGAFKNPGVPKGQLAMTVLVIIWGIRLSAFLFYRILMIAEDHRFDDMRGDPLKFLYFWIFQMMWVWIVSLPLTVINSLKYSADSVNYVDIIGIVVASVGLIIESVADRSKFNFKQDSANNRKWCDVGIWNYSRHPNYFGELLFWWGIFIGCSHTLNATSYLNYWERPSANYYTIVSPIFVTLLLFGFSGLPLLEKGSNKRFSSQSEYTLYRERTSILIPLPHRVYKNLPSLVKAIFLFEWPMYRSGLATLEDAVQETSSREVQVQPGIASDALTHSA